MNCLPLHTPPLALRATGDSQAADIKDAADQLFMQLLKTTPPNVDQVNETMGRLKDKQFTVSVVQSERGPLTVRVKTTQERELYSHKELKEKDSIDVTLLKLVLRFHQFPERINDNTLAYANYIGKVRAILYNTIRHIQEVERKDQTHVTDR